MDSAKIAEKRKLIEEEAGFIVGYVGDFEIHSAKDETALGNILSMLHRTHEAIDLIEEGHQKRIVLMGEMQKTVSAMEEDHKKFAEKHRKIR